METGVAGYGALVLAWAGYFGVHSLLAARRVKAFAARHWRRGAADYRLVYNLIALVLLVPPAALTLILDGPMVVDWSGPAWWLAQGLGLAAAGAFVASLRGYDMDHFLGLRQRRAGAVTDGGIEPWEPLRITGLHRFVRHPWYFLGLVILWTRDLHLAGFLTAIAITAYLVVGSRLEERKLVAAYGPAYRAYRRRVPGLVPLPGRWLSAAEATELARQANHRTDRGGRK